MPPHFVTYFCLLSIISGDCKWSTWNKCNKRCGPGKQTRYKKVTAEFGGIDCEGLNQQNCGIKPCPSKSNEAPSSKFRGHL